MVGQRPVERLNRIKAGFLLQGTTLTAWCRDQGIHRPNLVMAAQGKRRGPAAEKLVEHAEAAAVRGFQC